MSGLNPDARDKEEPQWARSVRAMMREKCTEGKGGKGEKRADDTIVLKKKKEATQGKRKKNAKGTGRRGSGISNPPSLADWKCRMK